MINFSKLNVKHGSKDGFVGIRQDRKNESQYEFCLPYGFEDFPEDDYGEIRDLFFDMYRTFKKFEEDSINIGRAELNDPEYQKDDDRAVISDSGVSISSKENEECVIYSKIRSIERILDAYSDLTIRSIKDKYVKSRDVDYSRIHEYLDKAVYLSNDAIFVNKMDMKKSVITRSSTNLVGIYCYILNEIIIQLDGDVRDRVDRRKRKISQIAEAFEQSFLSPKQSLFGEDTYESTMSELRDALSTIHQNTAYRDSDYWDLYEAVEAFLYGQLDPDEEGGDYWGIKGFGLVWDDICQTYFFDYFLEELGPEFRDTSGLRICFADTDVRITGYENTERPNRGDINRVGNHRTHDGSKEWHPWIFRTKVEQSDSNGSRARWWDEVFCIELQRGPHTLPLRRFPKPDIVLRNPDGVQIYDFKCVGAKHFEEMSDKLKYDLRKQLTYEYAAQQSLDVSNSIFMIPKYDKHTEKDINPLDKDEWVDLTGVEVYRLNFEVALNRYLKNR